MIVIDPENRLYGSTYFGGYDTRTLSDIFPTPDDLKAVYESLFGTREQILADKWSVIYAMIFSRYADSHIKSYSEDKFKLQLCSIIFEHGPVALKKYDIQLKLRQLSEEELALGTTQVFNQAMHDAAVPETTNTTWETPFINSQNVNKTKKSKINMYAELWTILDSRIFEDFLSKFRKLFVAFGPGYALEYTTEV